LFTNIDVSLAISIIERRWCEIAAHSNIDKELFFDILRFCVVDNNYFTYNDVCYRQKFGLGMGQSLSNVMSDIVLTDLFDECLPLLGREPSILVKYVDDVIITLDNKLVEKTQDIFNSFHERLKFTVEREKNFSIAFLDLKLIRTDNQRIITDWYTKDVSSNRLLNFLSKHPYNMKFNIAHSFCKRIISLSNPSFHKTNFLKVTDILLKNNYPRNVIQRIIKKVKFSDSNRCENVQTMPIPSVSKDRYISLKYIPDLTDKIKSDLKSNNPNLKFGLQPINKTQKYFTNAKSRINNENRSGVVYKIDCNECTSCYIGETSKYFKTRLNRHRYDFKNKDNNKSTKTALVDHCLKFNHTPNFNDAKIIGSESGIAKRLILESTFIKLHNSFNYKTDSQKIAPYSNIIKEYAAGIG
jgi:hypothetical protein